MLIYDCDQQVSFGQIMLSPPTKFFPYADAFKCQKQKGNYNGAAGHWTVNLRYEKITSLKVEKGIASVV